MSDYITPALIEQLLKNINEMKSGIDKEKETPDMVNILDEIGTIEKIHVLTEVNEKNEKNKILSIVNNHENKDDDNSVDVVIIFALPVERTQAFEALNVVEKEQNTTYYDLQKKYGFVFQKFKVKEVKVVTVTQTSMGMAMAASLTTRAILAFNPKLVVMTGICAGRQDKVNIGDILIADQVYDYTAGKIVEGEKLVRPRPISCDEKIKQILISPDLNDKSINALIRARWKTAAIPVSQSSIHIKAMGTGTSVVDDKRTFEEAIKKQDDLYGIDMEAYGVALASDVLHTPWLIIKGVQDFADGEKNTTESNVREYAAFASAIVLEKILPYFLI